MHNRQPKNVDKLINELCKYRCVYYFNWSIIEYKQMLTSHTPSIDRNLCYFDWEKHNK